MEDPRRETYQDTLSVYQALDAFARARGEVFRLEEPPRERVQLLTLTGLLISGEMAEEMEMVRIFDDCFREWVLTAGLNEREQERA